MDKRMELWSVGKKVERGSEEDAEEEDDEKDGK